MFLCSQRVYIVQSHSYFKRYCKLGKKEDYRVVKIVHQICVFTTATLFLTQMLRKNLIQNIWLDMGILSGFWDLGWKFSWNLATLLNGCSSSVCALLAMGNTPAVWNAVKQRYICWLYIVDLLQLPKIYNILHSKFVK